METDELYRELQRHLDRMPVPFPATESGVELRILKHLFTPEEARLALCLSAIPEPLEAIRRRAGRMAIEELRQALERMAEKGSIQKAPGKGGPLYGKSPLVLGMYEAQVDRLTPEFERDMRAYLDEKFGAALLATQTPQMRTAPVNKSIEVERAVAQYDDIRAYVEGHPGPFAALNCICRQGKDLTGEPCRQTKERRNCLVLGAAAMVTMDRGISVEVTKEGMLALLEQADREGLVLQPQNTQEPIFVCCCCGCCCGVLTSAKKLPRPAYLFQTDFVAEVDRDACQICGACAPRCQMDAIASGDEPAAVAEERCIGCGLCVTSCPSGALRLRKKEGTKPPPGNMRALYTTMFQERFGRLGTVAAVAGRLVGRKF
ncbi:MAG: 4Fe-4S binding protein [Acidobacteriia bacterium]|nr:4Fe-4S binding protein [Terriglobia bacterium]